MSDRIKVSTMTPIGEFVVDVSSVGMYHIIENNKLILNQILYRAEVRTDERVVFGYTFTTSVDESLLDKITEINCLLINPKAITIYPVYGGYSINQ